MDVPPLGGPRPRGMAPISRLPRDAWHAHLRRCRRLPTLRVDALLRLAAARTRRRAARPSGGQREIDAKPQRGIGVVAPFDFALDRELWRWVPDEVSLHLTRTPFVPVEVSLELARLVSEHETLGEAVRALTAVAPEVVAYACASGSFVGGIAGERATCAAMTMAGSLPALTTSGALLEALAELGARRVALVTPYTGSVTRALREYVGQAGVRVTGCVCMGLTRHIWKVPYRDVVAMARRAARPGTADALFLSCTNLPTYDVIPQLEAELRMPVISANQVTMWAALRRLGTRAVGPYQALLDAAARAWPVLPEEQQEGWT